MAARPLALVTGGNTGIGREAARLLAAKGYDVVIACRDARTGGDAADALNRTDGGGAGVGLVTAMRLDLASFASVRAFASEFRAAHGSRGLKVLVCNAGLAASFSDASPKRTADGLELTVGTNHYGHFLLVRELLPALAAAAPSRVVSVASSLHYKGKLHRDDPQLLGGGRGVYSGSAAYNNSKLMNVLFALGLHARYARQGVTAVAVHPGFIPVSSFLRSQVAPARGLLKYVVYPLGRLLGFTATVAAGGQSEVAAALAPQGGLYFDQLRGPRTPAPAALDEGNQAWLWAESERVTGAVYPASL